MVDWEVGVVRMVVRGAALESLMVHEVTSVRVTLKDMNFGGTTNVFWVSN